MSKKVLSRKGRSLQHQKNSLEACDQSIPPVSSYNDLHFKGKGKSTNKSLKEKQSNSKDASKRLIIVDQNCREENKKEKCFGSESPEISTPSFISFAKDIPKKKTVCFASFSSDSQEEKSLISDNDQQREIIRENLNEHSSLLSSSFESPDISQEIKQKTNSKLSTKRKSEDQAKNEETEAPKPWDTPKTRKFCSPPAVIRREFELKSMKDEIAVAPGDNRQSQGSQKENLEPRLFNESELRRLIRSEWINMIKESLQVWESKEKA